MSERVLGRLRASLPRLALLTIVMAGLWAVAFVEAPLAQGPSPVQVAIQQADWVDRDGQVTAANSSTAFAEFSFSQAAAEVAVGEAGAFLNLYTSIDGGATYRRAVENLFVHFDSVAALLAGHPRVLVDLGNAEGAALASVLYQVSLTRDPVGDPASGGGSAAAPARASAFNASRSPTPSPWPSESPTPYPSPTPSPAPSESPTPYPSPTPLPSPLPDLSEIRFRYEADSPDDLPDDYVVPLPAPIYYGPPLPGAPVGAAVVQHTGLFFGGYGGGGLVRGQSPGRPFPWRPELRAGNGPPGGGPRPRAQRAWFLGGILAPVPSVIDSPMSCAPSAIARSIRYMAELREIEGAPSAQDIADDLYDLMGTSSVTGTSMAGILGGKAAYSNNNGLGIQTVFPASIEEAVWALNNGGDVELDILWGDTDTCEGGGGHVAMVTSISLLPNGNLQITYTDDQNQNDDEDGMNGHTLVVEPDGDIVSGFACPNASVAGLLAEMMP